MLALMAAPTLLAACAGHGVSPSRNLAIATVPYRSDGVLMMVPVRVNGADPAWFTVDSGASHSVLDTRLVDAGRLIRLGRGSTTGTGSGAVDLERISPAKLAIGPVEIAVDEPWEIDLSHVPLPPDTRGLLGSELFANYVVRIDPDAKSIQIFEPGAFVAGREP